jgi:plastocyanin
MGQEEALAMMVSRLRLWVLAGGAALVLGLAGAALAGIVAHSAAKATRVTVTEREYKLTLSTHSFKPGGYVFVAVNRGKVAHSLAISGPGITLKRIAGVIKPGASRSLTVTLRQGKYKLWCPQPGHAGLGMSTSLKVGGGAAAPPPPPTSTGKKGGWG